MTRVSEKYGRLAQGGNASDHDTRSPGESARKLFSDTEERVARQEDEFELALSLAERDLWSDARDAFQKLAVSNPKVKKYRLHLHYAWGREHEAAHRTDQAKAEFRRALTVDPTFERAKLALDALSETKRGLLARLFKR